jgi:hypothetical protein
MSEHDDPFLSRWSRRKAEARRGAPHEDPARAPGAEPAREAVRPPAADAALPPSGALARASGDAVRVPAAGAPPSAPGDPPPPTLDDVARLTRDSDYAAFMRPGVAPGVKNAALRKLFSDPHFNVMDGLDVYIDDYSQPDPIPAAMLRKLNQAVSLGLFEAEEPGGRPHEDRPPHGAALEASASPERPSPGASSPPGGAPPSAVPDVAAGASDPPPDEPAPPLPPVA